jgi:hypothetical protein
LVRGFTAEDAKNAEAKKNGDGINGMGQISKNRVYPVIPSELFSAFFASSAVNGLPSTFA